MNEERDKLALSGVDWAMLIFYRNKCGLTKAEALSIVYLTLLKCAANHNHRFAFSTYVAKPVMGALRREFYATRFPVKLYKKSLDWGQKEREETEPWYEEEEKTDFVPLWKCLNQLRPRDRRLLTLRYGLDGEEGKTLKEIGKMEGLSRQRVQQLINRIQRRLRSKLDDY